MSASKVHHAWRIAAVLLLLSTGIRILLTRYRTLNADEFQHLHASWMVHSGLLPYQDFWENHTPLLYYLLSPLFGWIDAGTAMILAIRGLFSVSGLLILWLTYLIAKICQDRLTALFSAVVLSFSVLFLQKTIEVRPDQFVVILWLGSLYFILEPESFQKRISHFVSGFLLGIAFLFAPKALVLFAALVLLQIASCILSKDFKGWIFHSFISTIGFLIPPGICLLFFQQHHAADLFLQHTLLSNFRYPRMGRPYFLFTLQHIVFFLLGLTGMLICLMDRARRQIENHALILLSVPCTFLLLVFFFVLPGPYSQSALPFVPLLAIFGGLAVKRSLETNRIIPAAFALIAAILIPCSSFLIRQPTTQGNGEQLQLIETILSETSPGDVFFDGNAAYVYRPQAFFYGSLVEGIRASFAPDVLASQIIQSLKEKRCKYVIFDDRIEQLSPKVQMFIQNNYVSTHPNDLMIAGRDLFPAEMSGNKARFLIEIPLVYRIQAEASAAFSVDGKRYEGPVALSNGWHEIVSESDLTHVSIRGE